MNAKFYPAVISGTTEAQALSTLATRYFTIACLAKGQTKIYLKNETDDLLALKDAFCDLGASITRDKSVYTVTPLQFPEYGTARVDIKDSLLALRFVLPVITAVFEQAEFGGSGRLAKKDFLSGLNILKGVTFDGKSLPFATRGKLLAGEFMIEPETNSQVVCALMLALPLTGERSRIVFREKPKKQLSSLLELTVGAMRAFGASVEKTDSGYLILGDGYVAPEQTLIVDGDYSTAGYFLAHDLLGGSVTVQNLNEKSFQPEKEIVGYLEKLKNGDSEISLKGKTNYIFLLTALASMKEGKTTFTNFKLKDKDGEKFSHFISTLSRLGANIIVGNGVLTVQGKAKLGGGIMLDTFGDARLAMTYITISGALESPVTVLSIESAALEQSSFLNEHLRLGAKCEVV